MGKYSNVESDIFSIFGSIGWKAQNIKTIPTNFVPKDIGNEYIRVSIIMSQGIDIRSLRGLIMIDIFTPAGKGPKRTNEIADKLDQYLVGKVISTTAGGMTQCMASSINVGQPDSANPGLFRTIYQINFNYYGVN